MIRLRPVLVLLVIGALAAGVWWWRVGRGPEVTVVAPSRGTAAEIVYATGSVEPVLWAKVGPIVRGRIIERCRCEGSEVKAGQVLARLDDREARHTQRELIARRDQAQRELDRQLELRSHGVASPQALERAQTELRQIEALIAAQGERIENYRLVSPMDGTVLREDGEVGEVVDTNTVLYRVGQPHPLRLVAEVNEEDIPRVKRGQVTLIRADAFPERTLEGKVDDITPAGDPVAKTFRVYVGLPENTPLKIGMSVEANIVAQEKANALLVPTEAIVGGAVFVVENGVAVRRKVETGIKGTRAVEIVSGITEGDRVVSPVPSRFAGGRVRASEKPQEPAK
ncbi:efflux RND transporter periplasmic adaptor subunit [Blastochloris sulfoviridis]|uniref:Efflux RND transporter periplasmic adaptor subunit n=1 Tax=Blastochloris sulfoviridis TaxID=50712 RepID=A0A5M6HN40_9HYPH|nr:efflux RND transporter periplasmic adaptor subunit [Blastochloris sulfoviridis]KAA5597207.1 efflux RND transporter periplasmic adaptor subunit [Blastochloris sulfoviridis]